MSGPIGVRPGSLAAWRIATRPQSLPIAISPVVVGTVFAWASGARLDAATAVCALVAAVMIQLVTNLQNDVGYAVRGAEDGTRVGLPRATPNGWLSVPQVRIAIVAACLATVAAGWPLVRAQGWPVLAMGLASLAAALAYMGGPRPLAYTPFGELTAFAFFGPVAVAGSEYVQRGLVSGPTVLAAIGMGAFAAAALAVNNHRDVEHDRGCGRRTFAVAFGSEASRRLYRLSLAAPYVLLPGIAWAASAPGALLPLALAGRAWRLAGDFGRSAPGPALNGVLMRTFRMELEYALLLCAGVVLSRWVSERGV